MSSEVRVLTPPGRGAIAVIQFTAGTEDDTRLLESYFQCLSVGVQLRTAPIGRILYGRWRHEDVVVVRTAESVWEIHCHGGTAAVATIVRDLNCEDGNGSSVKLNHSPETAPVSPEVMIEQEILRLLLRARTRRTAAHLLAQTRVLAAAMKDVLTSATTELRQQRASALRNWQTFAAHLTEPWRVLILGSPNVGKSSLLNALAGFDRSIVFDQPGTTRDLIEAFTVLNDWPFVFVDSAGIRAETEDEIEHAGIQSALMAIHTCDACLLVLDASASSSMLEVFREPLQRAQKPVAVVLNKADLLSGDGFQTVCDRVKREANGGFSETPQLTASALTGQGMSEITAWLVQTLIPVEPELGTPLPLPGMITDLLQ